MRISFSRSITRLSCGLVLMVAAPLALAYIGPGSGISVIGSLLGLLATIAITIGAIILFPFRRMMKKRGKNQSAEDAEQEFKPDPGRVSSESAESEGLNPK